MSNPQSQIEIGPAQERTLKHHIRTARDDGLDHEMAQEIFWQAVERKLDDRMLGHPAARQLQNQVRRMVDDVYSEEDEDHGTNSESQDFTD